MSRKWMVIAFVLLLVVSISGCKKKEPVTTDTIAQEEIEPAPVEVEPTPTPQPSPTPASSDDPAPSNWVVDRVQSLPAAYTSHPNFATPTLGHPAKGAPFIDPDTGHRITRISDVGDVVQLPGVNCGLPWNVDGYPSAGFTNGYARWTNINVTGEYAIAFRTNAHSCLYRLAD